MFCDKCGNQVREGVRFCPACGNEMRGYGRDRNLFSDLLANGSRGNDIEFALWIANCIGFILSFIAVVGCSDVTDLMGSVRYQWVFLLLLLIGQSVLIILRLRMVVILYNICWFFLLRVIPLYRMQKTLAEFFWARSDNSIALLLFMLVLLLGGALLVCACVHFFSSYDMKKAILVLNACCFIFLSIFLAYSYYSVLLRFDETLLMSVHVQAYYRASKMGFGMMAYLLVSIQSMVYITAFFRGNIPNHRQKFRNVFGVNAYRNQGDIPSQGGFSGGYQPQGSFQVPDGNLPYGSSAAAGLEQGAGMARQDDSDHTVLLQGMGEDAASQHNIIGLQGVAGFCQGQVFPLQGEVVMGSQSGSVHILVRDSFVSRRHCSIRFNEMTGNYEVQDMSSNGVFFSDGRRFPKGSYVSCPRGTIIHIGSSKQQFCLL